MKNTGKIALIFLLLFVNAIVMSCPSYAASIWDKRKGATGKTTQAPEPVEETTEALEELEELPFEDLLTDALDPEDIFIPDQYGSIIETHKGTNGKLIIHVQDAHANYEGQINAAKILESLIEDVNLNVILPEGQFDERGYKYLRDRLPLEERIEVADRLVKNGYFTVSARYFL